MSDPARMDELIAGLRAEGHRITTARRAVLEAVLDAGDDHLSAEDLAARIHRTHPDVHLSTVYRTVDLLDQAGLLAEVHLGPGPSSYHLADDAHHHAVCDRCGRVQEISAQALAPVVTTLDRELGFEAHPRHLTVNGLCAECRGA